MYISLRTPPENMMTAWLQVLSYIPYLSLWSPICDICRIPGYSTLRVWLSFQTVTERRCFIFVKDTPLHKQRTREIPAAKSRKNSCCTPLPRVAKHDATGVRQDGGRCVLSINTLDNDDVFFHSKRAGALRGVHTTKRMLVYHYIVMLRETKNTCLVGAPTARILSMTRHSYLYCLPLTPVTE